MRSNSVLETKICMNHIFLSFVMSFVMTMSRVCIPNRVLHGSLTHTYTYKA
ncbi:hypothetical protein EXN66_Car017259 [Channa argus]|uniref:Uncharacterized protein n=1 Tax=Channa argus TaxID=215402 RepID=A0A6G1QFX6_CHAAH|nr:hypothetical protein EXN66_Car017259 [Channa argus]